MQQTKIKISSFGLVLCLYSITLIGAEVKKIIPIFVEPITVHNNSFNNIRPNWSINSKTISYERFNNQTHEIAVFNTEKKSVKFISNNLKKNDEFESFILEEQPSRKYAFDLNWSSDSMRYVFVSNGSTDNFDLYIGNTNNDKINRITFHDAIDNQPSWSPNAEQLVFVSSRHGRANLYLYDINKKNITPLLRTTLDTLNPTWSPDGKKLAFMLGEANSFQIYIIDDIQRPQKTLRKITNLTNSNNIRPSWSPDGSQLAFFTLNLSDGENRHWNIVVVQSDSQSALQKNRLQKHIISRQVVQNSLKGPSWFPDSKHIAYIKYINDYDNPVQIVNIKNKTHRLVVTKTKINRDVVCSNKGILSFQNQDQQWSRIFTAKLPALTPKYQS